MKKDSEWYQRMLALYKTDEAISAKMRENRSKAANHGRGGFYYLKQNDPERLKDISKKGGEAAHERDKVSDDV